MSIHRLLLVVFSGLLPVGLFGAPAINTPPAANTVVVVGQPANLSVAATGTGTLTYQWRRNGFNLTGATNATFGLAAVTQSGMALR